MLARVDHQSWRMARRIVFGLFVVLTARTLLFPQWHVLTPSGATSEHAWLFAAAEQPYGRDLIEWGPTLLQFGGVLLGTALLWWLVGRDRRRAARRQQTAAASGEPL